MDPIYQWPTCTACGRPLWQTELGRYVCRPCESTALQRLTDIRSLFADINSTDALLRGSRRAAAGAAGGDVPAIPPRIAALSLAAAGGVASRLQAMEDAWRSTLGWTVAPWRGSPGQAVPEHVHFLRANLTWAAESYESVDQDLHEIHRLHTECTRALSPDPAPAHVKVGQCPAVQEDGARCGEQLVASSARFRIRCRACGSCWEGKDGWEQLRTAQALTQVRESDGAADADAA